MGFKLKDDRRAKTEAEFRPAQDYLLIRFTEVQMTEAGIVLPGMQEEHESTLELHGEVVKAGPGKFTDSGAFIEQVYEPGDYVEFRDSDYALYKPLIIHIDNVPYYLVNPKMVTSYVRRG